MYYDCINSARIGALKGKRPSQRACQLRVEGKQWDPAQAGVGGEA